MRDLEGGPLPAPSLLPRLVLVTGPRVLELHAAPQAWLVAQLDALDPAVVVTGDAEGPDRWAARWAAGRPGERLRRYDLSGMVTDVAGARLARWTTSSPPASDAGRALWGAWCLHRDRVMVRSVAARLGRYRVTVVALGSVGLSRTHGTAYTVLRAQRADLSVLDSWWGAAIGGGVQQIAAPPEGWSLR